MAALIAAAALTACRQPEAAPSGPAATAAPAATTAPAVAPGSSTAVPTAPVAAGQVPAPIAAILDEIKRGDTGQLAISPEDGQFLRMLVASTGRKRALEIGAAQGYSAIWIGMAMRDTGGKLVTIEYDPVRAREAADNIRRAGVHDVVTVVSGDAFKAIPALDGTFDLVFLDAWKPDYKKFFDLVFPRVNAGGLFLAHNVINKKSEMPDFLQAIHSHRAAYTTTVSPGHEGISMTYKKR